MQRQLQHRHKGELYSCDSCSIRLTGQAAAGAIIELAKVVHTLHCRLLIYPNLQAAVWVCDAGYCSQGRWEHDMASIKKLAMVYTCKRYHLNLVL